MRSLSEKPIRILIALLAQDLKVKARARAVGSEPAE